MEEKINIFRENLEENYIFTIVKNNTDSGANGNISYAIMYKKDDAKNKILVALKTYKNNSKIQFDNEKQFFKDIEKLEINSDCIVKCYGTTHLNGKEYIVMEDLTKYGFVTIAKLYAIKMKLYKTRANQIKTATETLEQIKKELFETKTVVHGDLHSGNIMMNLHNSNVKLIDFGSSKIIKNKDELTEMEQVALEKDVKDLDEIICEFGKVIPTQDIQK